MVTIISVTARQQDGWWRYAWSISVTVVLMILGMVNFATAYRILKGNVRAGARNSEMRQMGVLLSLGVLILLLGVVPGMYGSLGQRARVAVFHSVAALSTTGFATVDYRAWNGLGHLALILLMLVGGGTGSTAGGIKQYRILVLFRGLAWEFRRRLLPRRAVTEPDLWKGEDRFFVSDRHLRVCTSRNPLA